MFKRDKDMDEMQRTIDRDARAFAYDFTYYVMGGVIVVQLVRQLAFGAGNDSYVTIVLLAMTSSYAIRKRVLERRALMGSEDEPQPVWEQVVTDVVVAIVLILVGILMFITVFPYFL